MTSEADVLAEAKERFSEAQDAWSEVRAMALDDLRFARLGEQWPDEIARQRQLDGRPCLTINRLPTFIRQVVNDARQNKPTIRVRPVDSGARQTTAEIFNGIIRHIEAQSDADIAYDTAIDCSVTQGMGFFYIDVDYVDDSSFDMEIFIRRIADPQAVLFDPASIAADSSDWRYAFVTDMMPIEVFKKTYPGAEVSDWDGKSSGWFTKEEVRVSAYWCRDETTRKILQLSNGEIVDAAAYEKVKGLYAVSGVTVVNERKVGSHKVTHRIMSGAEVLEETPWAGKYIPVVPVFGDELNVDGKRYFQSLTRHAKDPQRMFNYWRTTETELIALAPKAPWVGPEAAFDVEGEAEKWATANTQSHAFLRYKGVVAPERQPFAGIPAGALQAAMNAADDLKSSIGLFDASMGAPSNETSGRAIMARQREGDVGSFHFIDNLTRAIRCAGRIVVDLIPAVYTPGRIIRILGEDGLANMIKIGKPAEPPQQPPIQPGTPPEAAAQMQAQFVAAQKAHETAQALEPVYDLEVGRYDVEAKAGPSFTSRREEAAAQMIEMVKAFPAAATVIAPLLAKNLDWPDADKVAEGFGQAAQGNGTQGAPDVVGAAKVQAQAKIMANREELDTRKQMNRENLVAEAQMARDKMQFEATQTFASQQSDDQRATADNLTKLATTAIQHGHKYLPQHQEVPAFLKPGTTPAVPTAQ